MEEIDNENTVIEDVESDTKLTEPTEVKSDTVDSESDNEAHKTDDVNLNHDELEKLSPEKSVSTPNVAEDAKVAANDEIDATAINQTDSADADESADKPTVPIQTYLWEDVKRSKEQVSLEFFYCMNFSFFICLVHPTHHLRVDILGRIYISILSFRALNPKSS